MILDELRSDISRKQKKGLPFILASVVIWLMITIISSLTINIDFKNILVFSSSAILLPISWLLGRMIHVDIFAKTNGLGDLGFLFTINQLIYLLIVGWVYKAAPYKMIMVYAMVFGGHLLPYSWLYKSKSYKVFAFAIPILALVLENVFNTFILSGTMVIVEIIFSYLLTREVKSLIRQK